MPTVGCRSPSTRTRVDNNRIGLAAGGNGATGGNGVGIGIRSHENSIVDNAISGTTSRLAVFDARRNEIRDNGYTGVLMRTRTRDFRVSGNRFRGNSLRRRGGTKRAKLPVGAHVRQAEDTSQITLVGNQFLDDAGR